MTTLREKLKKMPAIKTSVLIARTLRNKYNTAQKLSLFKKFMKSYKSYQALPKNPHLKAEQKDLYPRIYDNTGTHSIDPVYFYQDSWCAGKVFAQKPAHHYDIGSEAKMVGIISQFVPTTMIDIRPITLTSLPNLFFIKGDITALPFKDGELHSLSSICVIEHIGLGRYGDTLDQFGTEKAAAEIKRVLAKGGNLYMSVPIDDINRVYFNAHRAFTRDYVVKELFKGLTLVEEKYIYGDKIESSYDPKMKFGTGLYHFKK